MIFAVWWNLFLRLKLASQCNRPVYSHLTYDITDEMKVVDRPDVLIIEGLNVLQSGMDYPHDPHRVFISDFLDFSIYVDADSQLIEKWYIERFMKFRQGAFKKPAPISATTLHSLKPKLNRRHVPFGKPSTVKIWLRISCRPKVVHI